MISRFFIHRPIFAAVLSIVIILAGAVAIPTLPIAQYPDITPPTVQVSCSYPGANAQVVADTVAAPIEQQVNGVENMLYMSSQCTNDGAYVLTVTFDLGTDLKIALVQVQNRVQLAMPQMPQQVQLQGVNIKKKSPAILMAVSLFSPGERYDSLYMSNYAMLHIRDELMRLPGVSDVTFLGERDYSIRAWLDPEKLAARSMTAGDVASAIREQNNQMVGGQLGQPPADEGQNFQPTLSALGRLTTPEQFGQIIVKTGLPISSAPSRPLVRLRDVARPELGAQQYDQSCLLDGKPSVALAIFQTPTANMLDTAAGVRRKMRELKAEFSRGTGLPLRLRYDPRHYRVDRRSPENAPRRHPPGGHRRAGVPAKLEGYPHPADGRARGHRRHVCRDGRHRVQPQQPLALRSRAGHRHRRRRRHRCGRERRAVAGRGAGSQGSRDQGHGRGHRPGRGRGPGPLCGLRPLCFHQRHHRAVLPPIRPHDRRLDGHLGLQLADLEPGAGRPAPQAAPARQRGSRPGVRTRLVAAALAGAALGSSAGLGLRVAALLALVPLAPLALLAAAWNVLLWLFNAAFDWSTNIYTRMVGRLLRGSMLVLAFYGGLLCLTWWGFVKMPSGFIPEQDKGKLLVNVQLPEGASVQRTHAVVAKIDRLARAMPGVQSSVAVAGPVDPLAGQRPELRLALRDPQAVRRAARPPLLRQGIGPPVAQYLLPGDPGSGGQCFRLSRRSTAWGPPGASS